MYLIYYKLTNSNHLLSQCLICFDIIQRKSNFNKTRIKFFFLIAFMNLYLTKIKLWVWQKVYKQMKNQFSNLWVDLFSF